jgi:GDP-D-mannose 3',5'-epimerase
VTGAGGFIGSHLVTLFKKKNYWVRGVDIKYPEFSETDADEFEILDLRRWDNCLQATRGVEEVYALAADMGGMGFISNHHAQILYNNSLINLHTLEAAKTNGVKRYLYTSSACIYPEHLQEDANVSRLKKDAYPAMPQDAYGWEKLFPKFFACITATITESKPEPFVFTIFSAKKELGKAGAKKFRRRCAAKSPKRN